MAATGIATEAPAEELTIAPVNNAGMIIGQELSERWEEESRHTLNWVVLKENVLRQRVTTDIAAGGGQFDIVAIGAYEALIWDTWGWLVPLDDLDGAYDYEDIFKTARTRH